MDNDKVYHEPTEEEMADYVQAIQTQLDADLFELENCPFCCGEEV